MHDLSRNVRRAVANPKMTVVAVTAEEKNGEDRKNERTEQTIVAPRLHMLWVGDKNGFASKLAICPGGGSA
jgi:hypothetical protein